MIGRVRGVAAAGVCAGIKASGKPDVGLLVFETPASCAAVFTQNKLAAAPVAVSREHLARSGGRVRAVVVNSGNANAATGARGLEDARAMAAHVARALGAEEHEVLVASTGVIGKRLPMDALHRGIDAALAARAPGEDAGRAFRDAILTTDAFPKEAAAQAGAATVAGVCKGAGMIHPDMATMLAFVATDAQMSPGPLSAATRVAAAASFNAVHVDTHASTNDSFFVFATGAAGACDGGALAAALGEVSDRLAWLIARDGEGATKVTTVRVRGARTNAAARAICDRVAASALVRTALFGNDPNWGRFVSAVGNAPEVGDIGHLRCTLQGIVVFDRGEPVAFDAATASAAMRREDVLLEFELADGPGEALLRTSDLGYRYVEINAEYTT